VEQINYLSFIIAQLVKEVLPFNETPKSLLCPQTPTTAAPPNQQQLIIYLITCLLSDTAVKQQVSTSKNKVKTQTSHIITFKTSIYKYIYIKLL
jgi:hypothetical protein